MRKVLLAAAAIAAASMLATAGTASIATADQSVQNGSPPAGGQSRECEHKREEPATT